MHAGYEDFFANNNDIISIAPFIPLEEKINDYIKQGKSMKEINKILKVMSEYGR